MSNKLSTLFAEYSSVNLLKADFVNYFLANLNYLGVISVEGDNAEKFLQGQLTCNMAEITNGQMRLAAHCNPKGRILASFYVFKANTGYYLLLPLQMIPIILPELNKYAVFSKVKLIDKSEQIISLGVGGESAANYLENALPKKLNVTEVVDLQNCQVAAIQATIPRFLVIGDKGDVFKLRDLLCQQAVEVSELDWQLLDIVAGVATIVPQTSGLFTPHMLNYPALGAVSFNKGCYIGQEIIARTHYLGKSKRQLWLAAAESSHPMLAGDKIFNQLNQQVGTIVNAVCLQADWYNLLVVFNSEIDTTESLFCGAELDKLAVQHLFAE